ncbi:hypothetical protein [Endozoicomonas sp. Mp262]|uniref:hypothetical protein n=1 Tax=Endozoicomonas sp. Mp262 TaxID=2919499 RepID=UPI0021DA04E0
MSSICKTCANRNTRGCGTGACQVGIQRTRRSILRHQQRQQEAVLNGDAANVARHQQAILRLEKKLLNKMGVPENIQRV